MKDKQINYYEVDTLSNKVIVCSYHTLKNKTFRLELEEWTDKVFQERALVRKIDIQRMYAVSRLGWPVYHWHDKRYIN